MDHDNAQRGTGDAPSKEFLALTHGHEWVNFYESFDKLVQDHLSRSSDLLRRAMSLPEVADREVAQVRSEMEGKLAAERDRSRELLAKLRDEISASHGHVVSLAESVQAVVGDLDSLKTRVVDAMSSLELPAAAKTEAAAGDANPNGLTFNAEGSQDEPPTLPESEPAESVLPDVVDQADASAGDGAPETFSDTSSELLAEFEAVAAAASAAAETELDSAEERLDLAALAEDEGNADDAGASAPGDADLDDDAVAAGGDRPRPHWLSVTRIGSRP